jgi:hypothetical protein
MTKLGDEDYCAFMLGLENDIDTFLAYYGMNPTDTGSIISKSEPTADERLEEAIREFIANLPEGFPETREMALAAKEIENRVYDHIDDALNKPDRKILAWLDTEYTLFRMLEQSRYGDQISSGFRSVGEFVKLANTVLNRRKSRAGKSLEHHLAHIFDYNALRYDSQPKTEGSKRPDFIFPSSAAYHTVEYPQDKLVLLAAKTTCKDRWRQVITEAGRFEGKMKHLFTLQQGISATQMDEMDKNGVVLVVPEPIIGFYPDTRRDRIWTLKKFVGYTKEKTSL